MTLRYTILSMLLVLVTIGCSPSEQATPGYGDDAFEAQVAEYIQKFPYQDTFEYAKRYTGDDPNKLNIWVLGEQPALVKAGEDTVVRMNNDTYYKMAFVTLDDGPVWIGGTSGDFLAVQSTAV
jgi:hypothetical protein